MSITSPSPAARADWPQIADIIPNHDGSRPPISTALAGMHLSILGEIGATLTLETQRCRWQEGNTVLELEYEAFALGPQLFLVDAMPVAPDRRSLTLILDLSAMRALAVEATFPSPVDAQSGVLDRLARTGSQSAVTVRYRQGGLGTPADGSRFARSSALNGQHLRHIYSDTHIYDHIHHSDRFYTWFCREGPDKGLGDCEECDVFELGPSLLLFCWREKLIPCVGVMVENHSSMRSAGKICGSDAYTGVIGNTRVGATIQRIATTSAAE